MNSRKVKVRLTMDDPHEYLSLFRLRLAQELDSRFQFLDVFEAPSSEFALGESVLHLPCILRAVTAYARS